MPAQYKIQKKIPNVKLGVEYSFNLYDFICVEKSSSPYYKYQSIIQNKKTGKFLRVTFGAVSGNQYHDSTGLGLWSHKDTNQESDKWMHSLSFNRPFSGYCSQWFINKYLYS